MRQGRIDNWGSTILEGRNSNYLGTASVDLAKLDFSSEFLRERNEKIIDSLKAKFKKEGCYRLEPRNRVPALVQPSDFSTVLDLSELTPEDLLDNSGEKPPQLKLPQDLQLSCLHGRQRIEAAKAVLRRPKDRWWTIDLYIDDSNLTWQRELAEEYANSTNFSDGEIYCKIHQYNLEQDELARAKWWARLTKKKSEFLKRFLKLKLLPAALNALTVMPALWHGLLIGVLDKLLALKCDEEISHYLEHILQVWSYIFGYDEQLMKLADRESVTLLEAKAPGASKCDLESLRELMFEGKLFPMIRDTKQRSMIWEHLSSIEDLIPTIHTLFEDVKYLRPLRKVVMRLLPPEFKGTIRKALRLAFSGTNQQRGELKIQTQELKFSTCTGSVEDQIWYGILQIWLYAMRHFDRLVGECPKKEEKQITPAIQKPSSLLWHRFGLLADTMGFSTKEIRSLKRKNPDAEVAYAALVEARDSEHFIYDESLVLRHIRRMKRMFDTAVEKPDPSGQPTLLVDGPGEAISRRYGRIFQNAHSQTGKYLFLRSIYEPTVGEGDGISPLFVRRSVFFAFFGRPPKGFLFRLRRGNLPSPDLQDVMHLDHDYATASSSDSSASLSPGSTTSENSVSTSETSGDSISNLQAPVIPIVRGQESPTVVRPQVPESQLMVGRQRPENLKPMQPLTLEYQTISTSIEPLARIRSTDGEEVPADGSLYHRERSARSIQAIDVSEQMDGEHRRNQDSNTNDRVSFVLHRPDGQLVPMKLNCTRSEAEEIARNVVAARIHLFDKHGSGLTIRNCFDAVQLDPDSCIYLRQPPELIQYQIELSNTSVQFRTATGYIKTLGDINDELIQ